MDTLKKIIIVYCVLTSILLHLLFVGGVLMMLPAMKRGMQMGRQIAQQGQAAPEHVGVVEDVAVFKQGDHEYVGYAIDYEGQTLYVGGHGMHPANVGDEVGVMIMPSPDPTMFPFMPDIPMPKRLIVMVQEMRPPRDRHGEQEPDVMDEEVIEDDAVEAVRPNGGGGED